MAATTEDLTGTDAYTSVPTFEDVKDAAAVLEGVAHRTPVETSRRLNEELGVKVFCKAENKQRTGSFKFRGAYYSVSKLTPEQREKGIFTASSGNHAQALSLSSSLQGVDVSVIMPNDAPVIKATATKGYGGNVIRYDRYKEERADVVAAYKEKTGRHFLPSYDYKYTIAGQGTAAKELIEQVEEMGEGPLDYIVVCLGGGGISSGTALSANALSPTTKVISVEPESTNRGRGAMEQNKVIAVETPHTIADGAQSTRMGYLTFAIISKMVEKIVGVTDDEIVEAMEDFANRMKMIVEPTGCLSMAGLKKLVKSGEIPPGSKCGVIVTGGNVDMDRFCRLLTEKAQKNSK